MLNFIESAYPNRITLKTSNEIKELLPTSKTIETELDKDENIGPYTPNLNVYVLSPKSYIDIVTKDFSAFYGNNINLIQNTHTNYDQALQLFRSKGVIRVFVTYDQIKPSNTDKKQLLKQLSLIAVPIRFNIDSDVNEKLQKSFLYVKRLILRRIYRNNYSRH